MIYITKINGRYIQWTYNADESVSFLGNWHPGYGTLEDYLEENKHNTRYVEPFQCPYY